MLDYRTKTFLTVCKTLNFTTAAKQLNITQPAVSQHIHFLEKQYNTTLFAYKNKELSLTPSGEILYKHLLAMKNNEYIKLDRDKSTFKSHRDFSSEIEITFKHF